MGSVTGLTAERMQEIIDSLFVDATVVGGHLILERGNGSTVDAGPTAADQPEVVTSAAELAALTPVDGQEIIFVANAANAILWRFRYNEESVSAFKWEFIGGNSLYNEVTTQESVNSAGYTNLATAGPSITLPLSGDYYISIGMKVPNIDAAEASMSYDIGATAAVDADQIKSGGPTGSSGSADFQPSRKRRKNNLGAVALVAKYKSASGTAPFADRWMDALPIRVG